MHVLYRTEQAHKVLGPWVVLSHCNVAHEVQKILRGSVKCLRGVGLKSCLCGIHTRTWSFEAGWNRADFPASRIRARFSFISGAAWMTAFTTASRNSGVESRTIAAAFSWSFCVGGSCSGDRGGDDCEDDEGSALWCSEMCTESAITSCMNQEHLRTGKLSFRVYTRYVCVRSHQAFVSGSIKSINFNLPCLSIHLLIILLDRAK